MIKNRKFFEISHAFTAATDPQAITTIAQKIPSKASNQDKTSLRDE